MTRRYKISIFFRVETWRHHYISITFEIGAWPHISPPHEQKGVKISNWSFNSPQGSSSLKFFNTFLLFSWSVTPLVRGEIVIKNCYVTCQVGKYFIPVKAADPLEWIIFCFPCHSGMTSFFKSKEDTNFISTFQRTMATCQRTMGDVSADHGATCQRTL